MVPRGASRFQGLVPLAQPSDRESTVLPILTQCRCRSSPSPPLYLRRRRPHPLPPAPPSLLPPSPPLLREATASASASIPSSNQRHCRLDPALRFVAPSLVHRGHSWWKRPRPERRGGCGDQQPVPHVWGDADLGEQPCPRQSGAAAAAVARPRPGSTSGLLDRQHPSRVSSPSSSETSAPKARHRGTRRWWGRPGGAGGACRDLDLSRMITRRPPRAAAGAGEAAAGA